jgi:hypothetical protein
MKSKIFAVGLKVSVSQSISNADSLDLGRETLNLAHLLSRRTSEHIIHIRDIYFGTHKMTSWASCGPRATIRRPWYKQSLQGPFTQIDRSVRYWSAIILHHIIGTTDVFRRFRLRWQKFVPFVGL